MISLGSFWFSFSLHSLPGPLLLCCCQLLRLYPPCLHLAYTARPGSSPVGLSRTLAGKERQKPRLNGRWSWAPLRFALSFFLFSRAEPPTPPLAVRSRNLLSPRSVRRATGFALPSYLPTWVPLLDLTIENNSHRARFACVSNMRRAGGQARRIIIALRARSGRDSPWVGGLALDYLR